MQIVESKPVVRSRSAKPATADTDLAPIYPYDPPHELAPNLWQIKGSLSVPLIPRYMTIYRLPDGRLILYSAIAMHEDGMRRLEALGTPAILVIAHDRHQMDAPFYKARYPGLRVLAPASDGPRRVPVDGPLEELAEAGVRAYLLPGTTYHEAVLELPVPGGVALCTCELLGNVRARSGVMGLLFKLFGPPGGGFGVNRAVRWREVTRRKDVKAWLLDLSGRHDVRLVLVAHGPPVSADVPAAFRRAAANA